MKVERRIIFFGLGLVQLFLGLVASAQAQSKMGITGTVRDANTNETLVGVSVRLGGTNKGVVTDTLGRYFIPVEHEGQYALEFSFLGYTDKKQQGINVKSGQTSILNLQLQERSAQTLNQVTVRAAYRKGTEGSLLAMQKNSPKISSGVSSETIKRSPDRNASDVIKRVSGANIQDNKFVTIRGMSDRYNSAMLDQAELPSTEPNRKAFSFDIVPSSMIENLVVYKTLTPDLPGNFTGGLIQIDTKEIPHADFVSVSVGLGYNTVSTANTFLGGRRYGSNYLGFESSHRKLEADFPSSSSIVRGLSLDENKSAIRKMPTDLSVQNSKAIPNQNYQFSLGKVKELKGNTRLGGLFSLAYRNSQSISPNQYRAYHVYDMVDNSYKFSTNIGALANIALSAPAYKLSLKTLYNQSYENTFMNRTGADLARSADVRFYAFDVLQKSLFKSSLSGDHQLQQGEKRLNWTLSVDQVSNGQPGQRKVEYVRNFADRNDPTAFSANITGLGKANASLFSNMKEKGLQANSSYSQPINLLSSKAMLKLGLGTQLRKRDFDVRFIGLVLNPVADANAIRQRSIETLFAEELISQDKYRLEELSNLADNFAANSYTHSAFAMLDQALSTRLRAVWGLRLEHFKVDLRTQSTFIAPISEQYTDVLPSLNLIYSFTDKSKLRASYSRSLARPELRELAPFQYYDYELLAIQQGNPNLKRTVVDNLDLRYELYPSPTQVVSVSAFYKKFTDAIETAIDDVNSTPVVSYFNAKEARAFGVELELRQHLGAILPWNLFRNTTLQANISYTKSEVSNTHNPLSLEKKRPMVGQAPYILNFGLQQNMFKNTLALTLLYHTTGDKIYKAGGQQFHSVWEKQRDVLDLQLSYKLSARADIKFNASDLLNQKRVLYFDNDQSGTYTPVIGASASQDQTFSSFRTGSNYSLSFSYNF